MLVGESCNSPNGEEGRRNSPAEARTERRGAAAWTYRGERGNTHERREKGEARGRGGDGTARRRTTVLIGGTLLAMTTMSVWSPEVAAAGGKEGKEGA